MHVIPFRPFFHRRRKLVERRQKRHASKVTESSEFVVRLGIGLEAASVDAHDV